MMYLRIQSLLGCVVASAVLTTSVQAQQMSSYRFDQQNRGQLAVAMKQIEESGSSGGVAGAGGASGTTIVCGGGGATATANSTCIILNNSSGVVTTDQISDGDQSAQASEETNLDGNQISGADEVLSTLTQ